MNALVRHLAIHVPAAIMQTVSVALVPLKTKAGRLRRGEVELCGRVPAVEHSVLNGTSKILFRKAVEYTSDTGYSVDGKDGGPSKWVTTWLAGGTFSENRVSKPTSCTLPCFDRTHFQECEF